jgi:molybdopterin synthase catalytic subunit
MFRVTDKPINLQELVDCVTDPEAGAIATFIGTTRNNNEGRKVIALDYEAYPEMAEKELTRLGEEARRKWQICRMAIVHRVGPVQIHGAERNDRHAQRLIGRPHLPPADSPSRKSRERCRSGKRSL